MVTAHNPRTNGQSTLHHIAQAPRLRPSGAAQRVLLITDSTTDATTFSRALRAMDVEGICFGGGLKGLTAARSNHFDLVVVDEQLGDTSGLDVLRRLRGDDAPQRCLVLTSRPSISLATAAHTVGALGLVEKPLRALDVIAVVNTALARETVSAPDAAAAVGVDELPGRPLTTSGAVLDASRSVAERWASVVVRTLDAESDPKTVRMWAQAVGMSRTTLCECCRLVHVAAHDARDFTRLLRAICHSGEVWQPEMVLNLADTRTLKRLLTRGGFTDRVSHTPLLWQYLTRQRWIPADNAGLIALQRFLYGSSGVAPAQLSPVCAAPCTDTCS